MADLREFVQRFVALVQGSRSGHLDLADRGDVERRISASAGVDALTQFRLCVAVDSLDMFLRRPSIFTDSEPLQAVHDAVLILLNVGDRRFAATDALAHADRLQVLAMDWAGRGDAQQFAVQVAASAIRALRPRPKGTLDGPSRDEDLDPEAWDLPMRATVALTGQLPWNTDADQQAPLRREYWLHYLDLASKPDELDWVARVRRVAAVHGLAPDRPSYVGAIRVESDGAERIEVCVLDSGEAVLEIGNWSERNGIVQVDIMPRRALARAEMETAVREALVEDLFREELADRWARLDLRDVVSGSRWSVARVS